MHIRHLNDALASNWSICALANPADAIQFSLLVITSAIAPVHGYSVPSKHCAWVHLQNDSFSGMHACSSLTTDMLVQTPKIPMPPPFQVGWHLHNHQPVTKELHETLVSMLTVMNAVIDDLPKPSTRSTGR